MAIIELVGVVVAGRKGPVLDGCSLGVGAGEIHALVGAPGAGKSAVIGVLSGRCRPTRGVAQVVGLDCAFESQEIRRRVTFAPEAGQVDGRMSPRQHINWMLELAGVHVDSVRVRLAMRAAEIPDHCFDTAMSNTSPESHVLVWLAVAELRGHGVIVLDDPTRRLSFGAASRLARLLFERQSAGASILVATRDARFAENIADFTTVIEEGRTGVSLRGDSPAKAAV